MSTSPDVTANAANSQQSLVLEGHQIEKTVVGPAGSLTILSGVDIKIASGEVVAIVGPSGSGKSTLLGILAGLDQPTGGSISMLQQSLLDLDEDERARLRSGKVGFVFQSFQLIPGLTALENVMLPLELSRRSDAKAAASKMLAEVGLAERASHHPLQLSGGEQQRVAIARAFVSNPQLLFADEPTGNLDGETGQRIIDLMFALRAEKGSALVLVTHDDKLAARCDRRLVMNNGTLQSA